MSNRLGGFVVSDKDVSDLFCNHVVNQRNGGAGITQVRADAEDFVNNLSHFRNADEGTKNEYVNTLVADYLERN